MRVGRRTVSEIRCESGEKDKQWEKKCEWGEGQAVG